MAHAIYPVAARHTLCRPDLKALKENSGIPVRAHDDQIEAALLLRSKQILSKIPIRRTDAR
jgi:hypothetical protein